MPTVRDLEDLIIDAIYLDIVRGKLDQKEGQFEIEYTMGRDLEPGKLEQLLVSLQNWCVSSTRSTRYVELTNECRASTTAAVLATLDNKLSELSNRTVTAKTMKEVYDRGYQSTLKEVVDKQKEARNANKAHVFPSGGGVRALRLPESSNYSVNKKGSSRGSVNCGARITRTMRIAWT